MKKGLLLCVLLLFIPLVAAQQEYGVRIINGQLVPAEIEIVNGTEVTWYNEWAEVVFLYGATAQMRSGLLNRGESFTFVFPGPGVYTYADVNFGFRGKVTVTEKIPELEPELSAEPQPLPDLIPTEPTEPLPPALPTCPLGCTFDEAMEDCFCVCVSDDDCSDDDPCTIDTCVSDPVRCMQERKAGCAYEDKCYEVGEIANVAGIRSMCSDNEQWVNENSNLIWWGLAAVAILIAGVAYFAFVKPHLSEEEKAEKKKNKPVKLDKKPPKSDIRQPKHK